jgi:Fe-S-cluster containining protein
MPDQPGLKGAVPFRFQCQRSGRCCSAGTGYVWVEEDELATLAQATGLSREVFEGRHLRRVPDPRSGELRLSLREGAAHGAGAAGTCSLLEGRNHCSVYEARPRHCREFPFWPTILADPAAFESARQTCPGISPVPDARATARAFEALRALYAELDGEVDSHAPRCDMSGRCCRFEEAGHELYATALEVDFAAQQHPEARPPEAPGRCPYHVRGLCTARAGRPLGCRTYFCDGRTEEVLQEVHEVYLARIRRLERAAGYSPNYAPFPAQLAARGVGVARESGVEPAQERP